MGRTIASVSISVGVALSAIKILVGLHAGSAAVLSDGLEAAGDVLTSALVLAGLSIASKPPDREHPYGHGRYEILSGFVIGALLLLGGVAIFWHSIQNLGTPSHVESFALYPLIASIVVKCSLGAAKFQIGRRVNSASLIADAWHDVTDLVSTTVAICAVALTLWDPLRFSQADRAGGIAIGVIICLVALRVLRQTSNQLADAMPDSDKMLQVRRVALGVPGALGIEKCFARRTGSRYHVDLHLEVDPDMTVRDSHSVATDVRGALKGELPWVADVLVHVEPYQRSLRREPAQAIRR